MGFQSSARIKGDDYQFLFAWYEILALKKRNSGVVKVTMEDPKAGQVDDVTVIYNDGRPQHFYQVKYHVDHRAAYTLELLLDKGNSERSLLEKFCKTYKDHLRDNPGLAAKLHLVTNWALSPEDAMLSTIENERGMFGDAIRNATPRSELGKALKKVKDTLGIDDTELYAFLGALCIYPNKDCTEQFKTSVAERMEHLGLKSDEDALLLAIQVVKEWIKAKQTEIDLPLLEEALKKRSLYAPAEGPASATVYLVSVKNHKFDIAPDYVIDLRSYYADQGTIKGHELINGYEYNTTLLPKIVDTQQEVNDDLQATLIRARGFARLSPWFAFGHTFSGVSGYTLEVKQGEALWRTDEKPNGNFKLVSDNGGGEALGATTGKVAIGLGITGDIGPDVREHIANTGGIVALLLLRPEGGLGAGAVTSGGDLVALCQQFKTLARDFMRKNKATSLQLYYFGPFSGACFIGHQLNSIAPEVQVMEKLTGEGYVNAFLLK